MRTISCTSRSTRGRRTTISGIVRKLPLALAAMALLLCACKGGISSSPGVPAVDRQPHRAAIQPLSPKKIQHVIIIVQENRSFNNLFYGYPGAKTVTYGYDSKGQKITLKPIGLATTWDVSHSYAAFMAACDGTGKIPGTNCRMDGFDKVGWTCGHGGSRVVRRALRIRRTRTSRTARRRPIF